MKKSQLKNIIKESIKELMTEQSGAFYTWPFFNLANTTQPTPTTQFVGNIITTIINKLGQGQGQGCQFVCNRLNHLVNKYNTKVQSGAGAAQGGFGHTNQGEILASKINYLNNLGYHYDMVICQATSNISCGNQTGGCGCPAPNMLE